MQQFGLWLFFCLAFSVSIFSQDGLPVHPVERLQAFRAEQSIDYQVSPFSLSTARNARVAGLDEQGVDYQRLSLEPGSLQNWVADAPEAISIEIPQRGRSAVVADLVQVEVLAGGFQLSESHPTGAASLSAGLHYRGTLRGDDRSLVAISVFEGELMGLISDVDGQRVLGPVDGEPGEYLLYDDSQLPVMPDAFCGTPDDGEVYTREELAAPAGEGRNTGNCVRIYLEIDHTIFIERGNTSNTLNYITGLFNQVATLYAAEGINTTLSQVHIWTQDDPYTASTASNSLTQFRNGRPTFNGDLAALLSFEASGGIAYRGVLCNPAYAYSFSSIANDYATAPTYSWSVKVIAHELGHMMGSQHTHACVWNGNGTAIDGCYDTEGGCPKPGLPSQGGTIMSYCHITSAGVNFSQGFGQQPGNLLRNNVAAASCLGACAGGGFTYSGGDEEENRQLLYDTISLAANGSGAWQKVAFSKAFAEAPIVVAQPLSFNDEAPATIRIRNVSETGFEIRVREWDYQDGKHGAETIAYMAATEGLHDLKGIIVQAGRADKVGDSFTYIYFEESFGEKTPVVLASQTTDKQAAPTVIRLNNISATRFQVRLQEEEDSADGGYHTSEAVDYIALSPGAATLNKKRIFVSRTEGALSHQWREAAFDTSFTAAPFLLAAAQTAQHGDPAVLRYRNLEPTKVSLLLQEETSRDTELNTGQEALGMVVIGKPGMPAGEGQCPAINFRDRSIYRFGGSQDRGGYEVSDDGYGLTVARNGWKAIEMPYTVTDETILEFEFRSTVRGEVHGIGLDDDATISSGQTFRVYGTQSWGIDDYDNYPGNGQWVHYKIYVGKHYKGDYDYLFFAADHDGSPRNGVSEFRNVRLYEAGFCTEGEAPATATAVPAVAVPQMQAYPNPARDQFTLNIESPAEEAAQITVFDITGRPVFRQSLQLRAGRNLLPLSASDWPAGTYYVRLQGGQFQQSLPVVVVR